jgi:predicted CoA-binding protein
MSDDQIKLWLTKYQTITMVGLSNNPDRDSYRVADYLVAHGFSVHGVNPVVTEALGQHVYPSLAAVPTPVEFVDVFRRADTLPLLVDEILALGTVRVVWLQLGVAHAESESRLRAAGIGVISDRCIKIEHQRLFR